MLQLRPVKIDVNVLSLCGLELSFGLQHVSPRGDAAVVAVVGEIEGFLISDDRLRQELLLRVESAQLKIILGQFGARA